jgi:adenylate cyclase
VLATSDDTLPEPLNRVAVAYALDGTAYISEPFRSTAYKSEVVALAVPIREPSGSVIGVVTSVFDIRAMLEELVAHSRFNQSGYAIVVDGEGDVIAHPDASQVGTNIAASEAVQRARITNRPGSIVSTNARGVERLFYYYPFRSPATTGREPWVILSEINESEVLAIFGQLERQLLAAVGVVFLLSLVLAHQVATSIGRPLDSLKQFAARLGRGELDAHVDVRGQDVAGSLAASLDAMAAGLRERDRVKEVFGRYIATQVSDRILSGEVNLGGEARVVTILFSDIRNFTTMSEDMTPQQVVSFLNAYFSEMVEAVFDQGGILDKFLGDGLMAVFGSLDDQPDHAARAVRAALRMKALLGKINGERAVAGKPPVSIGIGIHTAEVIVGNIGSTKRLEYTVIGDGVNTSSRVQALNKEFGTTILITENTYAAVDGQFDCREMPATPLRGKHRALKFYEVLAAREAVAGHAILAGERPRIAPVA